MADLEPAEKMALTVALAQIRRGDEVPPNTTAVLVLALERVAGAVNEAASEMHQALYPEIARLNAEAAASRGVVEALRRQLYDLAMVADYVLNPPRSPKPDEDMAVFRGDLARLSADVLAAYKEAMSRG